MNQIKTDPLFAAVDKFLCALAAESRDHDSVWAETIHLALGHLDSTEQALVTPHLLAEAAQPPQLLLQPASRLFLAQPQHLGHQGFLRRVEQR